MDTFVKLENITKIYHMGEVEIRAVDGIDFSIQKGEFVVIVGPSGAGKTTVLNILGGMDTASGGRITVDGQDITKYSERQLTGYRRDDIGFVFQFYNLIPNLTALENVEMALQICRNPLDARAVLKEVGLEERMDNFPARVSARVLCASVQALSSSLKWLRIRPQKASTSASLPLRVTFLPFRSIVILKISGFPPKANSSHSTTVSVSHYKMGMSRCQDGRAVFWTGLLGENSNQEGTR